MYVSSYFLPSDSVSVTLLSMAVDPAAPDRPEADGCGFSGSDCQQVKLLTLCKSVKYEGGNLRRPLVASQMPH